MSKPEPSTFKRAEWKRASDWKLSSSVLPEAAREPAMYRGIGRIPVCLPTEFAVHNLLPDVRDEALALFAELDLKWHDSIAGGPSNHLLDSQVQCVNALAPMVRDPQLIKDMFGDVLPIESALPIEGERFLTFEFIGAENYLDEAKAGTPRMRGAHCTSADAAIRYRTPDGRIEIALIEWKYTEDYRDHELSASGQAVRRARYERLWNSADCPVRHDLIPYDDLFVEPFYQLFRQQLLAHEMERAHELDADRVRVLHIAPAGNDGYMNSLNRDSHRAAGDNVIEVWQRMVKDPSSFVSIDSSRVAAFSNAQAQLNYANRYGSAGGAHDVCHRVA